MEQAVIERLQAKSPEEAIIEQISRDFNLAPFMARTQFEQMRKYFEQLSWPNNPSVLQLSPPISIL